jgi:hypothetical protein
MEKPPPSAGVGATYIGYKGPITPFAVTRGPKLAMSIYMTRWHRPRWAVVRVPYGHVSYHMWCNSELTAWPKRNGAHTAIYANEVPAGHILCGTCEGRAVGAGYEPLGVEPFVKLHFTPRQRKGA